MPRLSREQRLRIIGMLEAGMDQKRAARIMRCQPKTIARLVSRYQETGSVEDRPRSGRPRVTTRNQDRFIQLTHLRDRFRSASQTAAVTIGLHQRPVSDRTIRRRLNSYGLMCRRPLKAPILTEVRMENRLQWARIRTRWTLQRWGSVLFTDECRFCVSIADGRRRVWRRRKERFARSCILQFDRWGGANVMVWGGISLNYRTPLVVIEGNLTAQRYVEEILQPHAIPFLEEHPAVDILQQDNARAHAARLTRDFLDDQDIRVMAWPPYSPDLNPIENLWDHLGRRVAAREPHNRASLIQILLEEWEAIPQDQIRTLIQSMRSRCRECVDQRGGHTHY
jgi:transposase